MVIKIDETEPNVFPAIVSTDVESKSNRSFELVLVTVIEGKAVRTRVRLDRTKAALLASQLNAALGD
jgi:hypothetical protein